MKTTIPAKKFVTFSFNSRNRTAVQFVKALYAMDFLTIEENPYNPEYTKQVLSMNENTFKPFDRSELWK